MSGYGARLDNVMRDLKRFDRRLAALERINQQKNLTFGNINLDASGLINVGANNEIIIDGDAGEIKITGGGDTAIIDSKGLVSTASFTTADNNNGSLNQQITTHDTDTDITGSSINFTLDRESIVIIIATMSAWINCDAGDQGNGHAFIDIDGVFGSSWMLFSGVSNAGGPVQMTGATTSMGSFAAGSHTIKLVGNLNIIANTPIFLVNNFGLSYMILGK